MGAKWEQRLVVDLLETAMSVPRTLSGRRTDHRRPPARSAWRVFGASDAGIDEHGAPSMRRKSQQTGRSQGTSPVSAGYKRQLSPVSDFQSS